MLGADVLRAEAEARKQVLAAHAASSATMGAAQLREHSKQRSELFECALESCIKLHPQLALHGPLAIKLWMRGRQIVQQHQPQRWRCAWAAVAGGSTGDER